ncbi:MAG: tetratricopeptide repeat protein [Spirochaetaceae bacterium]|nr:tetratricopeptide repeat protein [Spirochaetaceae bacterium]
MENEDSVLLIPDKAKLASQYENARASYEIALAKFLSTIDAILQPAGLRLTLKSRVKGFDSYYSKKLRLLKKAWTEKTPPVPVNDILAMRVICPFLGDLSVVESILREHFTVEEVERKGSERSFREFGYESIHLLLKIPEDLQGLCPHLERNVIEIQLRTILQEAWAEVEHELVYKAEFTPFDEPMKRKLAALNANLTLSDIIFQEILEFQKKLNSELDYRRDTFYRKIEEVTDGSEAPEQGSDGQKAPSGHGRVDKAGYDDSYGMDGLMLAALEAHNKADFATAISIYTKIIDRKPEKEVAAVVYKHRGMAYFAQSEYRNAMNDFSSCVEKDPECYKALYFRGVTKTVFGDYGGAIDDFTSALQIYPYHFFSRYRRAQCYWKMGDQIAAQADCEIALRIEPDNELARHLASQIREKMATDFF